MSREKTVFKDVKFTGDLHGRGSVGVEPGRLVIRKRGVRLALGILMTIAVVGLAVLLVVLLYRPAEEEPGACGGLGITVGVVFLAAIIAVRVFLAGIFEVGTLRPVITVKEYDVSPPVAGAEGQAAELRFVSRKPRRLEEVVLRFGQPDDARSCYEVFTSAEVFGEVELEGALRGRGSVTVEPGRLTMLRRGISRSSIRVIVVLTFFGTVTLVNLLGYSAALHPLWVLGIGLIPAAIVDLILLRRRRIEREIMHETYDASPPTMGAVEKQEDHLKSHGLIRADGSFDKDEVAESLKQYYGSEAKPMGSLWDDPLLSQVRFFTRKRAPVLEEYIVSFRYYKDAERCYEVFTSEEVPESAEV